MSKAPKGAYDMVRVRWTAGTYLSGYAGGVWFPEHEAGTPSLSEPIERMIAEQLVESEPDNFAIYEDELEAAKSEPVLEAAQAPAISAPAAPATPPQAAPAAVQADAPATPPATPERPRGVPQVQTEEPEDDDGVDLDADDEDDDAPLAKGPPVTYAPELRRPETREAALAILNLGATPIKREIADAYAARQAQYPAAQYPDHYAQATDAYNLLTLAPPPQSAPAAVPADAPAPPRPRRKPKSDA